MTEPRQPDVQGGAVAAVARLQAHARSHPRPVTDDDRDELLLRKLHDRWNTAVPARFRHAVLPDVDEPAASELFEWIEGPRTSNLVLLGPVGVGKTHAGVAALRECLYQHDKTIAFAPVVEALDWLRPGGDEPTDVRKRLAGCGVLLLDDLGAERPTDWTAERLYGIVNRRWLDGKPIIVTTNLEPAELERTCDERLFSRLVHDAVAIHLGGPDRRRAK